MKDANQRVFQRLAGFAGQIAVDSSKSKKYIKSSEYDKYWLKSVDFLCNEDLFVDRHRFFLLASIASEKYIVQVGFGPARDVDEDLVLQPNNGGLFVALAASCELPLLNSDGLSLELDDKVFLPSEEGEKIGFDYFDIDRYFVKYFLYKIQPSSSLLHEDNAIALQKSALYLLGSSPEAVYLSVSEKTFLSLRSTARLDVGIFPFDRVFRAFIERRYEHAFLDLYRCLEMLFSLKKIDILRERLKLHSRHFDISADVEAALGWRPTEKGALKVIIDQFPREVVTLLEGGFKNTADTCTNIYDLRNECVHFRPLQKKSNLAKQVNWIVLLEAMMLAIYHSYHVNYRKMF